MQSHHVAELLKYDLRRSGPIYDWNREEFLLSAVILWSFLLPRLAGAETLDIFRAETRFYSVKQSCYIG